MAYALMRPWSTRGRRLYATKILFGTLDAKTGGPEQIPPQTRGG